MTDSEKLDALVADVAFLKDVVAKMGWGGPRIRPADGSVTPPPGSPLANAMASELLGGTILAGYAGSNPGGTSPTLPPVTGWDTHKDLFFDPAAPNSYRIYDAPAGGLDVHILPVPTDKAGLVVLHIASASGNEADTAILSVVDQNSGRPMFGPVQVNVYSGSNPEFSVSGSESAKITITATDKRAVCAIRFEFTK